MAHAQRLFFIERPKLALNLSYEFEQDKREGPTRDDENTSHTYIEELGIFTRGWAYHPALLSYSLEISPEWEQNRETVSPDSVTTTESFLMGYDAELVFLQYKPYTFTLNAIREMTTLRNSQAERTKVESNVWLARLDLKYTPVSSSINYIRSDLEQTGFLDSDEEKDEINISFRHYSANSSSTLQNTYKDINSRYQNTLRETNSFISSFDNTLTSKDMILTSNWEYEETDITNSNTRKYSFSEFLNVTHRRNLSTNYNVYLDKYNRFDKDISEHSRTQSKSIGFGLSHLLYENLTTSFSADSSQSKSRSGRDTFHNANINWFYRRSIPWGILNINVGYNYSIQDSSTRIDTTSTTLVEDEAVTLSDFVITFLENRDVLSDSVIVTEKRSSDGFGIEYIEGIDYELVGVEKLTRIVRKPGGSIVNGQPVFVRYRYIPFPAFDYSFFNQNYGINVNLLSTWYLYYTLQLAKQRLLDGTPPEDFEFLDDSTHMAGVEHTWKWFTTTLEFEDRLTTFAPLRKWKITEDAKFKPRFDTFVQLSASFLNTTFKDSDLTEDTLFFSSLYQRRLSRRSNLTIQGIYTDTSGGTLDTTGTEISVLYEWIYRIWEFTLEYRYRYEDDKDIDQTLTNNYFLVHLKRRLF